MIEYPPEFPEAARAQVERQIAEAELEFAKHAHFSRSEEAVCYVLTIFEHFVRELTKVLIQHEDQWTAQKLRTSTQNFLDRLIEQAHADKGPSPRPLAVFRVQVLKELVTCPFWIYLQTNIQIRARREASRAKTTPQASPAATMTPPPMSDLVSVQAAAKHLKLSDKTVRRMQDDGRLPLVRIGRLRRVTKAGLRQFTAEASTRRGLK